MSCFPLVHVLNTEDVTCQCDGDDLELFNSVSDWAGSRLISLIVGLFWTTDHQVTTFPSQSNYFHKNKAISERTNGQVKKKKLKAAACVSNIVKMCHGSE